MGGGKATFLQIVGYLMKRILEATQPSTLPFYVGWPLTIPKLYTKFRGILKRSLSKCGWFQMEWPACYMHATKSTYRFTGKWHKEDVRKGEGESDIGYVHDSRMTPCIKLILRISCMKMFFIAQNCIKYAATSMRHACVRCSISSRGSYRVNFPH